ncbi:MAG: RsiV family protein [Christensenellales bacterium]
MRKAAIVSAAIVTLLISCGKAPPCVTVSEQTIVCGSDILVEDIRIPVVSGFSDAKFQSSLNSGILDVVGKARENAKQDAKAAQQWVQYVCVLVVDYEVKNNRGLFSMRLRTDLDNGGTGMPNTRYVNADIEKNKLLRLDDLFLSQDYKTDIDEYILTIINKDTRFSSEDYTGVTNNTAFFVSEGLLHIAFAKYEISSGSTGEPVFAIPASVIQKHLKPDYAKHFI